MPTATAYLCPSGKVLLVVFRDDAGGLTKLTALAAGGLTLAVDGAAPIALDGAIWGSAGAARTSWVIYPLAAPLASSSALVLTAAAGWASTAAGPVPGGALAVANEAGGSLLPPFVAGPRSMRVGTNHMYPTYWGVGNLYANIATQASAPASTDANGYPTGPCQLILSQPLADPTDPLGYANAPADGTWTVIWDGDYAANLTLKSASTLADTLLTDVEGAGGIGHTRTYRITVDGTKAHAPEVWLHFGAAGATNIRVYPPGEPTDGSEVFATNLIRQATGYQCIRYDKSTLTNASPVVEFADFAARGQFSFSGGDGPLVGGAVASIGPYTPPDSYLNPAACVFAVTFAAPHGARTGQVLKWAGNITGPNPDGSFPTTGGGATIRLSGVSALVQAIDATRIATFCSTATVAGVKTPGGTLTATYPMPAGVTFQTSKGEGMPPEDCAAFSNRIGADCWFNVPHAASDACVTTLAQRLAADLRPGLKCYVEYSNEHWNSDLAYEQYQYFDAVSRTMPGSGATATAQVSSSGVITGLTLTSPGSGYQMAPTVTIPEGTVHNNGAQAHTTLINGVLTIALDRGGSGYDPANPPAVTISPSINHTAAYVWRAARVHGLFASAFAAAGRAGDLVRVMGGQYHVPQGPTFQIVRAATRNGITFDALAVAPYFDNQISTTPEPTATANFDRLVDADMLHDFSQAVMLYGTYFDFFAGHRAQLDAGGLTGVPIVCYEGGMQDGAPAGTFNIEQRTRAWGRHPRMWDLFLYFLQRLQDAGVVLYIDEQLNYIITSQSNWGRYFGRAQVPGRGDGSDGLFDNRTNPYDMSRVVSVMGGALMHWLGLAPQAQGGVDPAPTPAPTPAPPPAPAPPPPPDMLAVGLAWLARTLRTSAATPVRYARGGLSATVPAVFGKKLLRLDDAAGGVRMEWSDLDFVIAAADLVLGGAAITPARGDQVFVTDADGVTRIYEVRPIGGEAAWRWCDPHRQAARIHTKLVERERPS